MFPFYLYSLVIKNNKIYYNGGDNMKRICFLILSFCIVLSFAACSNQSNQPVTENEIPGVDVVVDKVIVDEITPSYIVCTMLQTRQTVSIPHWSDINLQPNDVVTVYHNGYILEIEPVQFGYIFYIEYNSDGQNIKVHNPANNQIQIPNSNESNNESNSTDSPIIDTVYFTTYINDEMYEKRLNLSDAAEMSKYFKNMLDGTAFVCNCMPDYTIVINNVEYYYHSQTGVVFNSMDSHNYLVNNKDAVNEMLEKYLP